MDDRQALTDEQPKRLQAVRAAIQHAFHAYEAHAWGMDELNPLSKSGINSFDATGATIVDSLSTLWLADLMPEFSRAQAWVHDHDFLTVSGNLFETNIRVVGGLLSAGALSKIPMFQFKAQSIAQRMLSSFDTPSGIPCNRFPGVTTCGSANLAEAGTLILEFGTLSKVTGDGAYLRAAERALTSIAKARNSSSCNLQGLYPHTVSTRDGSGPCSGSMGGGNDSMYEYLLKWYLMSGDQTYKALWEESMVGTQKHLLSCSLDGLQFIVSNNGGHRSNVLEHLACFTPGMLALGNFQQYGALAASLTESCIAMYTSTASGVGADGMSFDTSKEGCDHHTLESAKTVHERNRRFQLTNAANIQRPEVLESVFLMWRFTRDEYYRDVAWEIFLRIEKYLRVDTGGYASAKNVNVVPPELDDRQQSFFLAETLKYLLLTFSNDSQLDLKKWVFNTEAHPLPVFS